MSSEAILLPTTNIEENRKSNIAALSLLKLLEQLDKVIHFKRNNFEMAIFIQDFWRL